MFITSNTLPVLISNTERILDVRGRTAWTPTGGRVTVLPPCAMAADVTAVTRGVTSFWSRPAPLKLMHGIRFAMVYRQYISAAISFCFLLWMFKIIWEGMERHNRAMRMLKGPFAKLAKGGEALYQSLMTKSTLDKQFSMMHENATKMKRFVSEKIDGDARKKYLDGVKAFRVQVATGTKNKVANTAQRANGGRKELINRARDIRGHFFKSVEKKKDETVLKLTDDAEKLVQLAKNEVEDKILEAQGEAKTVFQTIANKKDETALKLTDEAENLAQLAKNKMDEKILEAQGEAKNVLQTIAGKKEEAVLKLNDKAEILAHSAENKMDETFNAVKSAANKIVQSTAQNISKDLGGDRGDDEVEELHQELATKMGGKIGKIGQPTTRGLDSTQRQSP